MQKMMQQNFPHRLQFNPFRTEAVIVQKSGQKPGLFLCDNGLRHERFNFQLTVTYSWHHIKERKAKRIFMAAFVYQCVHQQNNFQIKPFLSRRYQSHLAIYNRSFLQCSRGYIFHHCTCNSGECNEKSTQHQNRNCKQDLMYLGNYV